MTLVGHTIDILAVRSRAVETALSLVGLAYPMPAYDAALYPHDGVGARHGMAASQSSCGLTCEAILRAVGADADVLDAPYGPRCTGHGVPALAWQEAWAREVGAWVDCTIVDPRTWTPPEPGDMWRQGRGSGASADGRWYRGTQAQFEHVGTDVEDRGELAFGSVEGGQPGILAKDRQWAITPGGELWVCAASTPLGADGRPLKGARVAGFIDLSLIPIRETP